MNNCYKAEKDKCILIGIVILLVAILVASSYYLINNWLKQKKENDMFKNLEQEIITDNVSNNVKEKLQNSIE